MKDAEIIESARVWLLEQLDAGWVPIVGGDRIMECRYCSVQHITLHHPDQFVRNEFYERTRCAVSGFAWDLIVANDGRADKEPDIVTRVRRFLEETVTPVTSEE